MSKKLDLYIKGIQYFLVDKISEAMESFIKSSLLFYKGSYKTIDYLYLEKYESLILYMYNNEDLKEYHLDILKKGIKYKSLKIIEILVSNHLSSLNEQDIFNINNLLNNEFNLVDTTNIKNIINNSFKDKLSLNNDNLNNEDINNNDFNSFEDNIDNSIKSFFTKIKPSINSLILDFKNTFMSFKDESKEFVDEASTLPNKLKDEINSLLKNKGYEKDIKDQIISYINEDTFNKLSEDSKSFLITGYTLYMNDKLNEISNVDYSFVSSEFIKVIEKELKLRFYFNYLTYLKELNVPLNKYPSELLYITEDKMEIIRENKCDLGHLSFLLKGFLNSSNNKKNINYEYDKSYDQELLKKYCHEVVFTNDAFNNYDKNIEFLVNTIKECKDNYRNKGTHDKKLEKEEADNFFNLFISKDKILTKMMALFNK